MPAEQKANEFLKKSHLFRLGHLPTEWPHPKTVRLSDWAQHDLAKGFAVLQNLDGEALHKMSTQVSRLHAIHRDIRRVLHEGGRIFLCGCGATGRLALTLEHLWRKTHRGSDQVVSFMAGGDVALVQALEGFEDYPEFGRRHLDQLGFREGDLFIGCTEGGETPFVIGAVARAAEISKNSTYFIYCNPTSTLIEHVERTRDVLQRPGVVGVELFVGPMALAGSTRMQASTVLQLAVGLVLLASDVQEIEAALAGFVTFIEQASYQDLASFTETEAGLYAAGGRVLYLAEDFAITVFTDTTERAPTFNLWPFESAASPPDRTSLAYLSIPSAQTAVEAWQTLLLRAPRALNWQDINVQTMDAHLSNFDFSQRAAQLRQKRLGDLPQTFFKVERIGEYLIFNLADQQGRWQLPRGGWLFEHLLLKMLLNAHSTLLMGRLGRYRNNIMTWVKPTNGKLIDRAARYVLHLLAEDRHGGITYEQVIHELFRQMEVMDPSASLVECTYRALVK